ncbi:hypothetical protein D9M73_254410 [compost metagenome]
MPRSISAIASSIPDSSVSSRKAASRVVSPFSKVPFINWVCAKGYRNRRSLTGSEDDRTTGQALLGSIAHSICSSVSWS